MPQTLPRHESAPPNKPNFLSPNPPRCTLTAGPLDRRFKILNNHYV